MIDYIRVPPDSRLAHIEPEILTLAFGAATLIVGEGRSVDAIARLYRMPPAALASACFQMAMALAQDVAPTLQAFVPDDPVDATNLRAVHILNEDEKQPRPAKDLATGKKGGQRSRLT